jgi:SulP family sulfate permease
MNWTFSFRPRLVDSLKDYSWRRFQADLAAGGTVGLVALSLSLALGIASGVAPQAGIYTAIIGGFLISALGGSRVQIGGPTGAFVPIVYGIVVAPQYGISGLLVCTMMAGVILIIMGATRMGSMIKFIPYPVTAGFTAGIAITLIATQIADFFGLQFAADEKVPAEFFEKMKFLVEHATTAQWQTIVVATVSLALIWFWPKRWARRLPASIVVVVTVTAVVAFFQLPVATIDSKFGGIPQGLPQLQLPNLSWDNIRHLVQPATTIALLAAIESLLSAVVADGMIEDRHDSNQELMAQGVANIVVPFFGGIPATGAIARTATNVRNGATSPVAGIIHALTLWVIILVAAPLAKFIPLAALAAVLVVAAINMAEWHEFIRIPKLPKSDAAVFLTTFALTVAVDLTVAVEIGMVLAAILFIKRISENTQITAVDERTEDEGDDYSVRGKQIPKGVMVYRIFGSFSFGTAEKLETALVRAGQEPEVLILKMRRVVAMDATGLNALESLFERLRKRHKHLVLCGAHTQPYFLMEKAGFLDEIGRENVVGTVDDALARARKILKLPPLGGTPFSASKEF